MANDEKGNLRPLMLSELIEAAQTALRENGDMPIWVQTCVAGYELNEDHSIPVSDPPKVESFIAISKGYWWSDRGFTKTFVIDGA